MQPLDITFVVGGLPFNGDTIKTKGLGGSETAAYYMARELAKIGHRVTVFSNTQEEGQFENVVYLNIDSAPYYMQNIPHDVCIAQRDPKLFTARTSAKLNILWCHDLAMKRNENDLKSVLWNIDSAFMVSEWHKKQWMEVYGLETEGENFYVTRNGIDFDLINSIRKTVKTRKKQIVYGSRPERGLDNMLDTVFPEILKLDPEVTLIVPTYDVGLPDLQNFYNQMYAAGKAKFGDRFQPIGSLSKPDLYRLYSESLAYVYPTPGKVDTRFREVSCISAMEAMACGAVFVGSDKGALRETLNGGIYGKLISGDPSSVEYARDFATTVYSIINDGDDVADLAIEYAKTLDWSNVAIDWSRKFESMIRARSSDKVRLFVDLWRNSDIVAAKKLIDEVPDYLEAKQDILKNYEFLETGDFEKHYEKVDSVFNPDSLAISKNQNRYQSLEEWICTVNPKMVLDYACHDGGYTTNLAKVMPEAEFVGVDINHKAISAAIKLSENTKNVKYYTLDQIPARPYDCLLMQEVLEHVEKPWELVDKQEANIIDGAIVYVTVPYGPWEYDSIDEYNEFREHIWHFDRHDLFEMFQDKDSVQIGIMNNGMCLNQPVPRGWWVVVYRKNGKKCREINMERKLWLQAPRQTVSLCAMAGKGSGEQSRWMLNSTKHIVQQYVVADTGMTDEDRKPWIDFGAKIVKAPDPRVHGFETPRNIALSNCDMDFVLWLDTDEKLVHPENIMKYLRSSWFDGYGIRQHHFAVDTSFPPDMPVRLFRHKSRLDGKKIRWYGMIHEHPETGINEGPGFVVVLSDVNIAHTGYLGERGRRERFWRNLPMLSKDAEVYPKRLLQKHFLMRDSIQMAYYHLQDNGGRVTPDIVKMCEDTIALYREYFLANITYHGLDTLNWYSQACEILGIGFYAEATIHISRENNLPKIQTLAKFASADDYRKFVIHRVDEELKNIEVEYW